MWLTWAMTVAAWLVAMPQPATSGLPEGLLARPITPGSVALLVLDPRSPDVQTRLTAALRDERPAVRSAAARVAGITTSAGQAAALAEALSRETDPIAAREEVRALLVVGGADRESLLAAAVDRVGGPAVIVLAESIARLRGADIVTSLPTLLTRSNDPAALADVLSVVVSERPEDRQRLGEGVIQVGDAVLWRAYLAMLDHQQIAVDTSTWLAGVNAPASGVQSATLFAIAAGLEDKAKFAPAVLDLARPAGRWPPASPAEADYAREFIARIGGEAPSKADWASLVPGLGARLPFILWSRMTEAERDAARAAGFGRGGKGTGAGFQQPPRNTPGAARLPARIAGPFVPGLFSEMAALTDCRLGSDADYAAARITYRPDGRPLEVSLVKRSFPKRCTTFVSAAMSLLVARADHAIAVQPADVVFLPLHSTLLACVDRPMTGSPVEPGVTGVTMPQVLHEEKPQYSSEAMRARVEGAVMLKAIVGEDGCVPQAEVLRALHPDLDLEALHAIMQWRFKPALRDGKPVAVRVTVEVGFRLER